MAKIDTVDSRGKLKPRSEPYWVKLSSGCILGFRKMTAASVGTWLARYRSADTGKREKRSLGEFDQLPPSQRYDAAKKAAEAWFGQIGRGGPSQPTTVKTACATYVKHVRSTRGDTPADDLLKRFERWIDNDEGIASIELDRLMRARVEKWRAAMASTPAKVSRDMRASPLTRTRSPGTVNRDIASLRAALNYAHDLGQVASDIAWRVALRPAKNADRRRDVYLDIQQRRAMIEHAPADVAGFLRGLALVPLRPGALAALEVRSFDARLGVLTIGKDKAGRDRRIKLPAATAGYFEAAARNRAPEAPLLCRADGKAWDKDAWKWPIKAAAEAAGLPSGTTCYAMRHSVITDLVTGGLDLLTVALLSGTSVAMIEKHYGHLRADHAAAALAALTL